VDSLKSVEAEVSAEEQAAAAASARRHFLLSYRYTWAYTRCVVVVGGLSGSGKSTVAAALQQRTGFAHLSSDIMRKQLAGVASHSRAAYQAGLYTPEHTRRTYSALLAEVGAQLQAGHGVIVDATFQRRRDRDAVRAVAAAQRADLLFVECRCPEAVVRQRLAARSAGTASPSDADWEIYQQQRRDYEGFGADEAAGHLIVDTSRPLGEVVAAIEHCVRA
jgi:hypothetical protein